MVNFSDYNHHWSYYLAIEDQLENSSRYVEFSEANLGTYSIEFARILLSAAAEADVLLKEFCKLLEPSSKADSVNKYQNVIMQCCPELISEKITMARFGITLEPWLNWNAHNKPPDWWTGNNKVKHHRNTNFADANLKNAINAVGALYILIVYYYKEILSVNTGTAVSFKTTTFALIPDNKIFMMNIDYYNRTLLAE